MILRTERLFIRPFEKGDENDLYEIYSDVKVCQYLLHDICNEDNKSKEFQKKLQNNSLKTDAKLNLACVLDEKVIGDISVFYTGMKETVEIGFVFNREYSKKGYAYESVRSVVEYLFKNVKIHRIQANLDSRNLSSAKLCERIGMRKEAHFIKDYWNKGEWTDSYIYGMLASDL